MADKNTVFKDLSKALIYGFDKNIEKQAKTVNSYTINNDEVLFKTKDKAEFEKTSMQMKQEKYLASQWHKAGFNLSQSTSLVTNNLKLMYRDADVMDSFPEIGAALDLIMEETNCMNSRGQLLNITSTSPRVKKALEDLFVNRLDIHVTLPMWTRSMVKYGNAFVLLNITAQEGIISSRQLPVYEIERIENGALNPYIVLPGQATKSMETEFVWIGKNEALPFKSWQLAHFRLLNDSFFLPYGVSWLHKGRRHFRILSMMEDMMLIYRLERGIERRVFKIFVGGIDDADIPAYVQDIANTFKRTPIVDPETGQLDLRKNMMDLTNDFFIPVTDKSDPTPIDVLPSASNIDKIEDLKFIQNKLFTALRVPKSFLNFEESAGEGKTLAIKDIRFTRTVNRIQQNLIMELNKIAMIHLHLIGLKDEVTNFKISMNSPSTQSEILRLEELSKRISLVRDAVQDPGNGIPAYSLTRAQREILGWTDEEITQNMLEIRMEKALAAELEKTKQIIKRTGFFDKVDDLYGEPNAEYLPDEDEMGAGEDGGFGGGSGGGGFGGGDLGGGDLEGGDLGGEDELGGEPGLGGGNLGGAPSGEPGEQPENNELGNENVEPTQEDESPRKLESTIKKTNKLLVENKQTVREIAKKRSDTYLNAYLNHINKHKKQENKDVEEIVPILHEAFIKNEETNNLIEMLDKKLLETTSQTDNLIKNLSKKTKK